MSRKPTVRSATRSAKTPEPSSGRNRPVEGEKECVYLLTVVLLSGPLPEGFVRKNPTISRTLEVRGDQTLHDLHLALAPAFGFEAGPSYEFRHGRNPTSPDAICYHSPEASVSEGARANHARLDELHRNAGKALTYWLDDGDGWWFRLDLTKSGSEPIKGKLPRVTARIGRNPPRQRLGTENGPQELGGAEAADTACLVAELHLSRGDYGKAVEAFSRAIGLSPTSDAYQGRARAYRMLAKMDEEKASEVG